MRGIVRRLVVVLVLCLAVVGCAAPAPAPSPATPAGPAAPAAQPAPVAPQTPAAPAAEKAKGEFLFVTTAAGTMGYIAPSILADIVKKATNKRLTLITAPKKGGAEVAEFLRAKQAHFGTTGVDMAYQVHFGKGLWEGKAAPKEIQLFVPYSVVRAHLVVLAGSPIKSFMDLVGKKVWTLELGSGSTTTLFDVLNTLDIKSKVEIRHGPYTVGYDALKDKVVDAIWAQTGSPTDMTQLGVTHKFSLVPSPADLPDKVNKKIFGGQKIWVTLPVNPAFVKDFGKGYVGDQQVPCLSTSYHFAAQASVPADVVYEVTKIFWEHKDELNEAYAPWSYIGRQDAASTLFGLDFAPVHPGALKYYKEIGIAK